MLDKYNQQIITAFDFIRGNICYVTNLTSVISGLTTISRPKSREVSTNDGIITQFVSKNIFNAAVGPSSETKSNTDKFQFCEHLISTRYLHQGYQI